MEYAELEKLWKTYDSKLNRLERLNKRLIIESLAKKQQKKINWLQFRNYYGLIIVPIALIIALHPQIKKGSIDDIKFVTGVMLLLAAIGYNTWHTISLIKTLKKVDLIKDTVIKSASKLNEYKKVVVSRFKTVYISMPITLAAVILIGWKDLQFGQNFYLLTLGLILFIVIKGNQQLQVFKKRMDKMINDINELKEYKE